MPICFEPLPVERMWGGRRMETVLNKKLPKGTLVGESWELVDRADVQSVVHDGWYQGMTLHQLWMEYRPVVFGQAYVEYPSERFPILIKIIDARERLSVQVHPPQSIAALLQGEPKSEMWYFLNSLPDAEILVGLKPGIALQEFEQALLLGGLETCLHRIPVEAGNSMFIPAGRVHAIGEGCLLAEVQQNSDTTYRIFDWNRLDASGHLRSLHLKEALACLNFEDVEPSLTAVSSQILAGCEFFFVEQWSLTQPRDVEVQEAFAIFFVTEGEVQCEGKRFSAGQLFLMPCQKSLVPVMLEPVTEIAGVLRVLLPIV